MKRPIQTGMLLLLAMMMAACTNHDDSDMQRPVISGEGIVANPTDCQVYKRGDKIPFNYVFTDNVELGNFNIEIHNNFDHHTHGTGATECPMDAKKTPLKPWVYNHDYPIPKGLQRYAVRMDIPIPADIDTGDYHFMIRLTDRAGWQELKAMSIKITE